MTCNFRRGLAVLVMLPSLIPSLVGAAISIDNLKGEAYMDLGQLVQGNTGGTAIDGHYLNRMGVSILVKDTVQERLRYTVGVGGIFWQPFPPGDFWRNNLRFGPGINEASTEFFFTPSLSLKGGYFPFKYASPAMNLGEYLLRTESYPTYLATGGWTWVDSAHTKALGLRLQANHFGGTFRHEAGLYWEYQNPPLYDLTPAYLFAWQPIKGLEIGGGAALRRWFTNNLSFFGQEQNSAIARPAGRYVEIANFPEVQNHAMVQYTYTDAGGASVSATDFAAWRPGTDVTSSAALAGKSGVQVQGITMIQDGSPAGMRKGIQRFIMNTKYSDGANCYDGSPGCVPYFDAQGNVAVTDASGSVAGARVAPVYTKLQDLERRAINLMGRVNLDFAEMLDIREKTGSFNLYGEVAVLGVRNQPVYYENMIHRMPAMVGMHVPTFGILDLLAVEAEYLNNPYQDSQLGLEGSSYAALPGLSLPIPDLTSEEFKQPRMPEADEHGDDVKWSVHAIRTLVPGVKLKIQAAHDHIRLHSYDPMPSPAPQTAGKGEWYYLMHLQWSL
jgi:hypothetical protein